MSIAEWTNLASSVVVSDSPSHGKQKRRIMAAIGSNGHDLPLVDEDTLFRYFEYLSNNLLFPFEATYLEPAILRTGGPYHFTVLELLHPSKHVGDPFDGIFCKTKSGDFEVNLPLLELHMAQDHPNFQLVEDYWYWFWNWR